MVLFSAPALAHPQGQRPVALIAAEGSTLRLAWVVAPDDLDALREALGLEDVDPPGLPRQPVFFAYMEERVDVRQDGARCPGGVAEVAEASGSFVVSSSFSCSAELDEVAFRLTLLLDLSPDYVTLAEVRFEDGRGRRFAFREGASSVVIDFAEGVVRGGAARDEAGGVASIVAALDGGGGLLAAALLAAALGALHGVTPGHGKTITAAYLVGRRGTVAQALVLGGVVAASHALSVTVLALAAVQFDELLLPSAWGPWLELATAILLLGLSVVLWRARPHTHRDEAAEAIPFRRLALIGAVGGLVPGPEAMAVVLAAFAIGRWGAGLLLVVAFSLGLAAVVLGVGVAAVAAGRRASSWLSGRVWRLIPRITAGVFAAMGVVVGVRALVSFA